MPYCSDDNSISIRLDDDRVAGPFNDGSCNFIVDEIGADFLTLVSSTGRQLYFTTGYSQHERPVMRALEGVFSVSADKKVHFSKGNLWADGSKALHFEANQYSSASSWDASHVSHFTCSSTVADAVGDSDSGDYLFCDENHKVSVDGGEAIYYALSKDEWTYLFSNHSFKWASVNGVNGYVIAPDDFSGELSGTYADDVALAAKNLVFLPAAGFRNGSNVFLVGGNGIYWSSTAIDGYGAYVVYFSSYDVSPDYYGSRNYGYSVRLITESN